MAFPCPVPGRRICSVEPERKRIFSFCLPLPAFSSVRYPPHLFVVQPGCQCEHSRLRIQVEDVVSPIGNNLICDLPIQTFIFVDGSDFSHTGTSGRVLRYVKRVRVVRKDGRIVVGVSNLNDTYNFNFWYVLRYLLVN